MMFEPIWILLFCALVAAGGYAGWRLRGRRAADTLDGEALGGSYETEMPLCAKRIAMLATIREAFPDHTVLPWLPAIVLLSTHGGQELGRRREVLRRFLFDFVVLDATGTACYVFKLGRTPSRSARNHDSSDDAFVFWALKQAGITIFRISSLESRVTASRLRATVGWNTDNALPGYATKPMPEPSFERPAPGPKKSAPAPLRRAR